MKKLVIPGVAVFLTLFEVAAATVAVTSTSDTTLNEPFPNNNMGRSSQMNVGVTGPSAGNKRMRGLMRFELTNSIPAGSIVTAVKVNVSVTGLPAGAGPGSTFELHRVLQRWTEGTKSGNSGSTAASGEVSWNRRIATGTSWGAAGATSASDINLTASSSVFMNGIARYTFPSTAELVADVQAWVDAPTNNFGWLINSTSTISKTARKVGSREASLSQRPTLEITYTPPLALTKFTFTSSDVSLEWTGGEGPYRVQRADSINGPWNFVTTATTTTNATAPLSGDVNYFRVAGNAP